MATVAFIGLGHMGNPMAANLVKAGQTVLGFDLLPENLETARGNGVKITANAETAVAEADVVITMLPAGKHVLSVYESVAKEARKMARFSSIPRQLTSIRRERLMRLLKRMGCCRSMHPYPAVLAAPRPVRLTFMVGGSAEAFVESRTHS